MGEGSNGIVNIVFFLGTNSLSNIRTIMI